MTPFVIRSRGMDAVFRAALTSKMSVITGDAPGSDVSGSAAIASSGGVAFGVLQPSRPPALLPPSRSEIERAIGLSGSNDSVGQQIVALQCQMNVLLRLFLSQRSWSTSPRLRSHSESPVAAPDSSREDSNGPPTNFECPICHKMLSEKSFAKHIQKWVSNIDVRIRKNMCAGIRSDSHPFLRFCPTFDGEPVASRVQKLVAHVLAMIHPGSYAAHSALGTGKRCFFRRLRFVFRNSLLDNHLIVKAFFDSFGQ